MQDWSSIERGEGIALKESWGNPNTDSSIASLKKKSLIALGHIEMFCSQKIHTSERKGHNHCTYSQGVQEEKAMCV